MNQPARHEFDNHGGGSFAVGEAKALNVLHGNGNSMIFQNHGSNFGVMGTASGNVTIINITLRVDGVTADETYERLMSVIAFEPGRMAGQNLRMIRFTQYCCGTLSGQERHV